MPGPAAPLLPAPLVITGHLVTLDPQRPEIAQGVLYIDDTGLIQAVAARGEPAPSGFDKATRVEIGGLVYPGLIDLHNHIAYNCLSLWIAPDRTTPWTRRDQWPNDPDYKPAISLPANALCQADGKAVLKYVETKAAVGGVTAMQGSAKLAHPFEGFMVRNVGFETFGGQLKKSVNQAPCDWWPAGRRGAPSVRTPKSRYTRSSAGTPPQANAHTRAAGGCASPGASRNPRVREEAQVRIGGRPSLTACARTQARTSSEGL